MIPEFSALMQKLEAERNDLSYKTPKEMPVRIIEVPKIQVDRKREKLMFNAGRYAAGARDKVAVAANEWLEKELDK